MENSTQCKHTPAPWVKWQGQQEIYAKISHHSEMAISGIRICTLPDNLDWSNTKEERDANAHLIASAPELLEALKYLVDYVIRECTVVHELPQNQIDYLVEKPQQAIAKAEGRVSNV